MLYFLYVFVICDLLSFLDLRNFVKFFTVIYLVTYSFLSLFGTSITYRYLTCPHMSLRLCQFFSALSFLYYLDCAFSWFSFKVMILYSIHSNLIINQSTLVFFFPFIVVCHHLVSFCMFSIYLFSFLIYSHIKISFHSLHTYIPIHSLNIFM